ncbi:hypothetical protein RRG08_053332 [Elysia crispata]|uniref:Uncharacterized protein n=1 Tax=Elysia crispata TaxID=231223 RepID=A0AAE0ZKT8_9GAST|nr:hypothetical protein RRG08_053332 [Elysia crispata]
MAGQDLGWVRVRMDRWCCPNQPKEPHDVLAPTGLDVVSTARASLLGQPAMTALHVWLDQAPPGTGHCVTGACNDPRFSNLFSAHFFAVLGRRNTHNFRIPLGWLLKPATRGENTYSVGKDTYTMRAIIDIQEGRDGDRRRCGDDSVHQKGVMGTGEDVETILFTRRRA